MRGFRAVVVASLSLLMAIACMGSGENQCLNPVPELPSCRNASEPGPAGGAPGNAAGGTKNGNSFAGSAQTASGGSAIHIGDDAGPPVPSQGAAGQSGDFAGAGGDSAFEPGVIAGAGGAAGAAGSDAP